MTVKESYKHPDKPGAGAKKRKKLHGRNKIHAVMGEFKRGTLRSSSGDKVTKRSQAKAIAMSEAGLSKKSLGDLTIVPLVKHRLVFYVRQ